MMKKFLKGAISILLTMALGVPMMSMAASAAETPAIKIPVTINITSSYKPVEDYVVVMNAEDESFPMPEGSENGTYSLKITGAATGTIGEIVYPKVGIYRYQIHQEAGTNSRGAYDKKVYNLVVRVTNAEAGGLEATTILYTDNENNKLGEVSFSNSYSKSSSGGGSGSGSSGGGPSTGGSTSGGPGVANGGGTGDGTGSGEAAGTDLVEVENQEVPLFSSLAKTGDTSNIILLIGLMAVSAGAIFVMVLLKKRSDSERQ